MIFGIEIGAVNSRCWTMPDVLEERFGLVLALRRREDLRSLDFEDQVTRPKWGNLKPGICEFSLRANSLSVAHNLLQELGLSPVPPDFRERYFASGSPFLSQVKGLVAKASGEFFMRDPWQVTVATSAGKQLTWALVKSAHSHLTPNLRDGQKVPKEPLTGPLSSHQVAKEFSCHHSVIGDVIKTRRRKKTTKAKQKQLQNPKLFKVCRSRGWNEVKGGKRLKSESHNEGAETRNQIMHEESKGEKRKRKLERKRERAEKRKKGETEDPKKTVEEIDVDVQVRRGNKKYGHLQAFVEKRRQKRQERRVQECGAFEKEREEEKSQLDCNARVCTHF